MVCVWVGLAPRFQPLVHIDLGLAAPRLCGPRAETLGLVQPGPKPWALFLKCMSWGKTVLIYFIQKHKTETTKPI